MIAAAPFLAVIWFYRKAVSPLLPACCRFRPTCSEYASQAIGLHGPFKGGWLSLIRLMKCHPFHPGGYDPVPDANTEKEDL